MPSNPRAAMIALCGLLVACTAARAPAGESARIAELLEIAAGMHVADVGAGEGEYSEALAGRVGAAGRLYATEVDEDEIETIRERLERAGIEHATVLLGDQDDTGLPENCCDAILLRLVYHHFTDPGKMRASLRRALRPGGRLLAIEIEIQPSWSVLDGVPDRGGHGIPQPMLIEEMTADGFRVVERFEDWPEDEDHYAVLFEETVTGSGLEFLHSPAGN